MRGLWRRLQWFIHRAEFDREIEEEMHHHLDLKAEEQGDATVARRQFGNVTLLKEKSRAMWTWTFVEQLAQDIRYSLRTMAARKLFTALAILSLALGIGANTAIYSFMDAILLRAMPVRHPEQLVILNWRAKKGGAEVVHDHWGSSYNEQGSEVSPNFPYRAYEFLRQNNHVLSALFGYANTGRLNLIINGQAELGDGQYISGNYFSGLGVGPAAGRLIGPEDDRLGAPPVVDISYNFWQQRFGGRSDAIGQTITLNGRPFTICGVSAPEFFGVEPQNSPVLFIPVRDLGLVDLNPFQTAQGLFTHDDSYWIEMMGRLRPGVTQQQAEAELAAQFHQWVSQTAKTEKERSTLPKLWLQEGKSGVDALRRRYSKPLFILMTAVGLILAIACANLANLLLARAASRRREIAVRLSLGAGRLRIIRQLLTESVLLSLCGALVGTSVAVAGIRSLTLLLGNGNPNFTLRAELDWRVLAFTLAVTIAAGLLFGIAPAIQATRVDVSPSLKEARIGDTAGRKRFGFRLNASHMLVAFQIAISLPLVAAAGLFMRTLENLHSVDLGFNSDKLLVFNLNAAQAGYKDVALTNFYAELQRRFTLIPGVRSATLTEVPLVADSTSSTSVTIPGTSVDAAKSLRTSYARVAPHFFDTMQIPIVAGRALDERDRASAPAAVVVNEIFVKKYLADRWPIGRHFRFGGNAMGSDVEVVGVARTARYNSLTNEIPPVVYLSYMQAPKQRPVQHAYFILRTAGDPLALANTVRRIVHEVGPQVPVANVTTESKIIDQTIVNQRTFADLCACFGVLALIMACVGVYATQAYAVTRRTSEIGIRMALGAERRRIIWMIVQEVLVLSSVGVMIGLCAVWETTTLLASFLFGLKAHDAATLEIAAAILMICAVLAGYAPARRASRIDPMLALRHE